MTKIAINDINHFRSSGQSLGRYPSKYASNSRSVGCGALAWPFSNWWIVFTLTPNKRANSLQVSPSVSRAIRKLLARIVQSISYNVDCVALDYILQLIRCDAPINDCFVRACDFHCVSHVCCSFSLSTPST